MSDLIPFNHDDVQASILTKAEELGYNIDYEGSNINQLSNLMAYAISMVNANVAINADEGKLSTAKIRKNILYHARQIGYEHIRKKSFQYKIKVTITVVDNVNPTEVTIPKYFKFQDTEGKFYYYIGDLKSDGTYGDYKQEFDYNPSGDVIELVVKEGILYQPSDYTNLNFLAGAPDSTNPDGRNTKYIDVPYENIENEGIDIVVTTGGSKQEYLQRKTYISDSTIADRFYDKTFLPLYDVEYNTMKVYFNYAEIGDSILEGATIACTVLVSSGIAGTAVDAITKVDTNDYITSIDVDYDIVVNGLDEESTTSIQENAPSFYNSANRLVTKEDYISFLEKQTTVKSSEVIGGEELQPVQHGNVYYTLLSAGIPSDFTEQDSVTYWTRDNASSINKFFIDDQVVINIQEKVEQLNVLSISSIPKHPLFIDNHIDMKILKYGSLSRIDTNRELFVKLYEYYLDNLEIFNYEYFLSSLIKVSSDYLGTSSGVTMYNNFSIPVFYKNFTPYGDGTEYNVMELDMGIYEDASISTGGLIDLDKLPKIDTSSGYTDWMTPFCTSVGSSLHRYYSRGTGTSTIAYDGVDTLTLGTLSSTTFIVDTDVFVIKYSDDTYVDDGTNPITFTATSDDVAGTISVTVTAIPVITKTLPFTVIK